VSNYEVPEPILNSPYEEPQQYWRIEEGESPEKMTGRRPAMYFYRDPKAKPDTHGGSNRGIAIELKVVNRIRARVKAWCGEGHPGVTRTTLELVQWWNRDGREKRLFFAQREAAETIIFLTEARADFRQGIEIARDEPSDDLRNNKGTTGFSAMPAKWLPGRARRR
jgi:type III restriction enzyme